MEPDGVVISTPTDSHIEMVKYFLEKTKKILVEKPISNNYESAAEFQKLNKK